MDTKEKIDISKYTAIAGRILVGFILVMFFLFPIYWILVSSFKSSVEISSVPPTFWPDNFIFDNWSQAFDRLNIAVTLKNSFIVSLATTVLTIIFCAMAGYVFSKKSIYGKNLLLTIIVSTMLVPPIVLLLPLYYAIDAVGLTGKLLGLILPFGVTAFGIFFMKKNIDDVPDEVIESAQMDGSGEFKVLFRIVLPMVTPALASLFIITFVGNWNSFIVPYLVVGADPDKFTLPVALYNITNSNDIIPVAIVLAAGAITIVPIVIVFLLSQKWFISGVMGGAVKG